jgi:hypothetical protein
MSRATDHRSFFDIAWAWSAVTGEPSSMVMDALVRSFWRGEFEPDGKSRLFALIQSDSPSAERLPGNYANTENGLTVKIGNDDKAYVTAERKQHWLLRRQVADVLCGMPEYCPWPWDGSDEGLVGLSTIPFEVWPIKMRDERYKQWHIQREHIAEWYRASTLSTMVSIEQFWPEAPPAVVPDAKSAELAKPHSASHTLALKSAPELEIRAAIKAAYDVADAEGKKPPNIKELPAVVQPRLEKKGYSASARSIQKVGEAGEFKRRRRQPGKTISSEHRAQKK